MQLSAAIGIPVHDVGTVTCRENMIHQPDAAAEEQCVGGCWVGLAEDFIVVDANSSAVVGPKVVVRGPCGCTSSTTQAQIRSCAPNTCLNGGRCLNTSSGTR